MSRIYYKLDASESAFFEGQLEEIRSKTYDKRYPELKSRQLIPIDNSVHSGAETITYYQYSQFGVAQLIASYADDLPRADVKGEAFTTTVKGLGSSYGYNVQEVRAAMMAGGMPLSQRKANAARRAIEVKMDTLLASGDSAAGLTGFLNQANANTYTIPSDGTGASPLWSTKTTTQIIRDLHGCVNTIVTTTNEVESPNVLLVPLTAYHELANTAMSVDNNQTILQHFLATSPYIDRVIPWAKLETAGGSSDRRMVAYKLDPDYVQGIIPQEFEQFPPQEEGLEFKVPCHARCGGVVLYYPLSMCYADGF